MTLTRHSCSFSLFGECSPETCTRQCSTAKNIDLNRRIEKRMASEAKENVRFAAAIVLVGCFVVFAIAAHAGLSRAERAYQIAERV